MKKALIIAVVILISSQFALAQPPKRTVFKNPVPNPRQVINTNCTGGQSWNAGTNKCECKNNFYWNDRLNQCRPIRTCAPGETFDREKDECVTRCTGGQSWNAGTNKCECKNNFYWNDRLNQCRPIRTCAPGETFDREKDECVTRCTGGQSWNAGTNKCECKNNFYWNDRLNQCRPIRTCAPGETFDREKDECVTRCTGGQSWNDSTNKCECKNNFYWNDRLNQCRPIRTCAPGETFDREKDVCVTRCTGGQSWNAGTNKCECKNNFYWNDRLNQCRPIRTCAPGETFDREKDECVAR